MVHTSCIVVGCKNTSSDPNCFHLSWHCLPTSEESLKQLARIHGICKADITKNSRICSLCMSLIKPYRKPPTDRSSLESATARSSHHRYQRKLSNRDELRRAIALDHTYSLSPYQEPSNNSSAFLRSTAVADITTIIPLLNTPESPPVLPATNFCIEMYADDDSAVNFYTSFPSYGHFTVCFNFLGDAVNHLIYPDSSVDPSHIRRKK